LIDTPVS